MNNNLDHYITRNLKNVYKRKLWVPILYLLLLSVLWIYLPVDSILFPTKLSSPDSLSALYSYNDQYVQTTLTDLKFTGYTESINKRERNRRNYHLFWHAN